MTAVRGDQAYAGRYTVSQREETSGLRQAASVYCLMPLPYIHTDTASDHRQSLQQLSEETVLQ